MPVFSNINDGNPQLAASEQICPKVSATCCLLVKATGKLEPARKASLHFQVSGQINERFVEPGTKVKAKDQMLSVDSGDFVDAVEESKALLEIKRDTIKRDLRLLELIKQERELQEEEVKRLKDKNMYYIGSKYGRGDWLN